MTTMVGIASLEAEGAAEAASIRLTNEERAAVRKAVVRALNRDDAAIAIQGYPSVSSLSKAALIGAARTLGLDVAAIVAGVAQDTARQDSTDTNTQQQQQQEANNDMTDDDAGAVAPELDLIPAQDIEDPTGDTVETVAPVAPAPEAVESAVRDVLKPLGLGDMDGFRAALRDVVGKAMAGPVIQVRTRTVTQVQVVEREAPAAVAREGEAPFATKGEGRDAGALFPALKGHGLASRKMATWVGGDPARTPAVDPLYVWPDRDTVAVLVSCLSRGKHVWLYGPAGTGKTTLAQQVAAATGREFVRVSCTDTTEAQELVGMTVPAAGGGTRWQDGQLTAAIRRPGTVVLIDEPTVARAGALFVLQAVLDSRRLHVAETGEVVPVAPGVLFLLADNTAGVGDETGSYEGTGRINKATRDRPDAFIRVDYLPPAREAEVLAARSGCNPVLARTLAYFAAETRQAASTGHVTEGLGLRRMLSLAERLTDGVEPATAWRDCVLNSATPADREHLGQLWQVILSGGVLAAAVEGRDVSGRPAGNDARNARAAADFAS